MTTDELCRRIIAAVDPLGEGEVAYKPEGVAIAVVAALREDGYTISRRDCDCRTQEAVGTWNCGSCGAEGIEGDRCYECGTLWEFA